MCLMFPEGQPNVKEEPDVNIKNHSLLKEDKRQFILESNMDAHSPETEYPQMTCASVVTRLEQKKILN